jgi:hypothetical protein
MEYCCPIGTYSYYIPYSPQQNCYYLLFYYLFLTANGLPGGSFTTIKHTITQITHITQHNFFFIFVIF